MKHLKTVLTGASQDTLVRNQDNSIWSSLAMDFAHVIKPTNVRSNHVMKLNTSNNSHLKSATTDFREQ